MKRVTGIGGVFFKAQDQEKPYQWYEKHLGIQREPAGEGASFHWRESDDPERRGFTAWAIFPEKTKYSDPSRSNCMINYRVDDLDALLDALAKEGVRDRSLARGLRLRTFRLDHGSEGQPDRVVGAAEGEIEQNET
jgi:hypothetical protein